MGRRIFQETLTNQIRRVREARGLSQAELAQQTGITRQAISAIETGQYVPNTVVALKLASALGESVERLFAIGDISQKLLAKLATVTETGTRAPAPVRIHAARVGEQLAVWPIEGANGFVAADGITVSSGIAPADVEVELFVPPERADQTVVILGCDPSLGLLADHVHRSRSGYRVIWRDTGSLRALRAVRGGHAHIAGTHLWDPVTGESNIPTIRRELAGMAVTVISLSRWQQGLMTQRGASSKIRGIADLPQSGVSIVNREPGSGTRLLFDHHLSVSRINPELIQGYDRLRRTHVDVAHAVRDGVADCGPGILSVARAFGLDFLPLQEERYDLVIPTAFLDHAPVQAFLQAITERGYRRELDMLGGYDSSLAGTTIAELGA